MFMSSKFLAIVAAAISVAQSSASPVDDGESKAARANALAALLVDGKTETVATAAGTEKVSFIVKPDYEAANKTSVEKRAGPGVFVTNAINYGGAPLYFPNIPVGLCINIPTDWQNAVSSFGPDTGLVCYGYHFLGCTSDIGTFGPIYPPGVSTPEGWIQNGVDWNDKLNSYRCYLY